MRMSKSMVIDSSHKSIGMLLVLVCFITPGMLAVAQNPLSWREPAGNDLPENWESRLRYKHFISAPISRLSNVQSHQYTQREDSRKVAFQIKKYGESVYLLFIGADEYGEFPLLRRGNISIKRDATSGDYLYMTVMTRDHPGCFVRMYPGDGRTYLDVVLFGVEIHHRLILPKKFSSVLFSPITQIIRMTRDRIHWDLILNRGKSYNALKMIEQIRSHLPRL